MIFIADSIDEGRFLVPHTWFGSVFIIGHGMDKLLS